MIRQDFADQIYKSEEAKFQAVVREIEQLHKEKRPVLIGTVSIENSEYLSDKLKKKGIPHNVLNAKEHTREGEIVAQAGQPGAVTVATNMAGRGVDIVLGEGIAQKGGLHIIGTERHEARRIDNQLRGRAGRQGDPGSSRFYVSVEDEIVRRFGGDRIKTLMNWVGLDEDTPIENRMVNRAIESAQVKVEGYHFDIRKHLVEYDDVVNKQRELIYSEREKILSGADLKSNILSMVSEEIQSIVAAHTADGHGADRDIDGLIREVSTIMPLPPALNASALSQMQSEEIEEKLIELSGILYEEKEKELGADNMRKVEKLVMLRVMDDLWVNHLTEMEHERLQSGWASLRQERSVDAYKRSGHNLFQNLLSTIQYGVAHTIYRVGIARKGAPQEAPSAMAQASGRGDGSGSKKQKLKVAGKKVGRNDPCPCGSGKKYKHCCGR
jgi:preprotein translocase subunit SecA